MEDRAFWHNAAVASRAFFVKRTNAHTGFAPDYADFDGSPHPTTFNKDSAAFASDAWRTASNWAVDELWWGRNPNAARLSDHLTGFFQSEGMQGHAAHYTLDGKRLSNYQTVGLIATNEVASTVATSPTVTHAFVTALWSQPIPSGEQRYYSGLLYMLSMLHLGGQFRVW